MSDLRTQSELDVLTAIERGEVVTQMVLTKRIGLSIGLVNAVLKRGIHKGFVKARQAPYKRYAYYLTPTGFSEKSRLVAEYLDGSLKFYRKARSEYAALFAAARDAGMRRLILYGGGELAEIAVMAAWAENVSLVALVDPAATDQRRYGLPVLTSLALAEPADGIVITEAREPQMAYGTLVETVADFRIMAPPLLRITRDQEALLAAAHRAEVAAGGSRKRVI